MIRIEFRGEERTIRQIAEITGRKYSYIYNLVNNCKSEEEIEERLKGNFGKILYKGKKYTIDDLMQFSVVSKSTFVSRIYCYGWDIEKALKTTAYKGRYPVKK